MVNQVAFSHTSKNENMSSFKSLMNKDTKFLWTPKLEQEIANAKLAIVKEVRTGVETYDVKRWTAIISEWDRGEG